MIRHDVSLRELLRRVESRRRVIIGRDLDGSAYMAAGRWLERQIRIDVAAMPQAHRYSIAFRLRPNKNPSLTSLECWAFRDG